MGKNRVITLPLTMLNKAANDYDFCRALALVMMIKANYTSSIVMDFSLRKLRSLLHINFDTMQRIYNKAVDEGLLKVVEYDTVHGEHRTDLLATKFKRSKWQVRFHVCETDDGVKLYMKSNFQDNRSRYMESKGRQSLNDVADLILLSKIVCLVSRYSKKYDSNLVCVLKSQFNINMSRDTTYSGMRKFARMCQPRAIGTESVLNTGFSYERFMKVFNGITRYKIMKLIRLGVSDRLFKTEKNFMPIKYVKDDNEERYYERSYIPLPEKGATAREIMRYSTENYRIAMKIVYESKVASYNNDSKQVNLNRRAFKGTAYVEENGEMALRRVWLMRMANSYFICSDVLRRYNNPQRYMPGAVAEKAKRDAERQARRRALRHAYNKDHVR